MFKKKYLPNFLSYSTCAILLNISLFNLFENILIKMVSVAMQ